MQTTHRLELVTSPHGTTTVMLGDRALVIGRGGVICAAARILLAEGAAKPQDQLLAYRGGQLSMAGPVWAWAELTVTGDRPAFTPYRPPASPASLVGAPEEAAGLQVPDD